MVEASAAVIGGSGLYAFLDDAAPVSVQTPYGPHSQGLTLGRVGGRDVAFLPRHGTGHRELPHTINYRANLWALRSLGVEQVLAPCAAGSLRAQLAPGCFAVPDQLVDRTQGRTGTYTQAGAFHVSFADPYCPVGQHALESAARARGVPLTSGGVMVVVEGPRFSTRAESESFSQQGWSLVNMTGMPEAVLARELAMCYSVLALVTDYDAGVDRETAVSQAEVFATFQRGLATMRELLTEAILRLPNPRTCACAALPPGVPTGHIPSATERSTAPSGSG